MLFAKAVIGEEVSMSVQMEAVSVQISSSVAALGEVLNKRQHGTLIPIGVLLHNCGVTRKKAKRYEENVKGWATIDC